MAEGLSPRKESGLMTMLLVGAGLMLFGIVVGYALGAMKDEDN